MSWYFKVGNDEPSLLDFTTRIDVIEIVTLIINTSLGNMVK